VKLLYLLRHAKSSWAERGVDDVDRPLAPRGQRAAAAMAEHLRDAHVRPALVLCSPALRTRQTVELLEAVWDGEVPLRLAPQLYAADVDDLLAEIRRVDDAIGSLLVVGHNPGLHDLALELAGRGDPGALARLQVKLPTAALVTLAVPSWHGLQPGVGELVRYVSPKELS